jgi:hypothetical protein
MMHYICCEGFSNSPQKVDQSNNLVITHRPRHGDCTHALQPGVLDVYAADFAALLVQAVDSLNLLVK